MRPIGCPQSCPAQRIDLPCAYSIMATSVPYYYSISSNLQYHPMLKRTYSFSVPKLYPRKPIKLHYLKEICEQGSLQEAFQSFGSFFSDQTSYGQFCLDEAYSPVLELCASKKSYIPGATNSCPHDKNLCCV